MWFGIEYMKTKFSIYVSALTGHYMYENQHRTNMKITLIQQNIIWADPKANTDEAERLIDSAPGSDLYILPEMFSTGFCTSPEGIAEPVEASSLEWMKECAGKRHCAIAGSIAVNDGGKYFNRFYFVKPDGSFTEYDKKHLFTYGGEHLRFSAGRQRVTTEYGGVRFLPQICYDLRFPVWARNRKDYDMAIYVASWPTPRVEAWKALLKARAIENQCYVAGVNRVGSDPACNYCGGTMLIDPYGRIVAECREGEQDMVTAEINIDELNAFRKKFPVLDDADDFTL